MQSDLHETLKGLLEKRMDALTTGVGEKATRDQRHLQDGSEQRAYWHYGYASALKDVLAILDDAGGIRPN
jgi:hypothetical protein